MKKYDWLLLIRGIGIGFILASTVFYFGKETMADEAKKEISDEEVIDRAKDLGLIPIARVEDVYLTDEEVIEKAKELGMEFEEAEENIEALDHEAKEKK